MRKDDQKQIAQPFRSSRFFNENGKWYYEARGGIIYGPFLSKREAENDCQIRFSSLNSDRFIKRGLWYVNNCDQKMFLSTYLSR